MVRSEIKIMINIDDKKIFIDGEVSLKAIMGLVEGLDQKLSDYTICQIEEEPMHLTFPDNQNDFLVLDPPYPVQPYVNPNQHVWEPYKFGPWYCGIQGVPADSITITFTE